ncbi:unnamed protein product [Withania somnifera]
MSCQGCVGAVNRVLGKMEGVESYDINIKEQKVTVKGNVEPEAVFQTVSKTGKKTSFWEAEAPAPAPAPTPTPAPAPVEPKTKPEEAKPVEEKPTETPVEPEPKPVEEKPTETPVEPEPKPAEEKPSETVAAA